MSEDQTQRLIGKLAEDLTPVRRVPRLGWIALVVFALMAGVALYAVSANGVRPGWRSLVTANASYTAVLVGLLACGLGATLAALAGALPGREDVVRWGSRVAALGLGAACLVGLGSLISQGSAGSLGDDWMCLRAALQLSPLPLAAVLLACSRGWVGNASLTAAAGLAGAAVAGALAIHLACPLLGARHFLLGHTSAPLLLALVGTLPAAWLLRRLAR